MTKQQRFFEYIKTYGRVDIGRLIPVPQRYGDFLDQVNLLKAALDSFRPLNPAVVKKLKEYYDVKFTYHSNAIEGNTLTERETALVLEKGLTIGGKPLRDHLEALGHREAINWIEEIASNAERPISEADVLKLHLIVFHKVDETWAGKYRTIDVRITGTNKVFPSFLQVQQLISQFITWLNSMDVRRLPTVERAAETHFRLVNIHPFVDGNGRVARLLMNLILLQQGFPIAVITNEQRQDYLLSLERADAGDLEAFKTLVLESARMSLCDFLNIVAASEQEAGKGEMFFELIEPYLA